MLAKSRFTKILIAFCILSSLVLSASASNLEENTQFVEPERVSPEVMQYMQEQYDQLQAALEAGTSPRDISRGCFYQVLYNNVNIRSGAGTNYPSYGYLQAGDGLFRNDFNPGQKTDSQGYLWIHLDVKTGSNTGVTGWVRSDQIKLIY